MLADMENLTEIVLDNVTVGTQRQQTSVPPKPHFKYTMGIFLITYLLPIVIALGTIGNLLSFLVLMKRRMRHTSVYLYLGMLTCADTIVLYLSGFKTWIRLVAGFEFLHVNSAVCKTTMLVFLVSLHMSAWLIVAVTTDRFLAVTYPLQASTYCTVHRAKCLSLILLIIAVIYNMHVMWTIHLYNKPPSGHLSCSHYQTDTFMEVYYPFIKLSTYSLLPFTIVLVLNTSITYKLWRSRKALSETVPTTSLGTDRSKVTQSQQRITIMLLVVSFMWLGLTAPFMLFSLVKDRSTNPETRASMFLFKAVGFFLMYCNHSINFYIYCCTGRKFRQELASFCLPISKVRTNSGRTFKSTLRSTLSRRSTESKRSQKSKDQPLVKPNNDQERNDTGLKMVQRQQLALLQKRAEMKL